MVLERTVMAWILASVLALPGVPAADPVAARPLDPSRAGGARGIAVRIGQDFRNLARRDGLVVLGLGAGLSLLAHPQDEAVATRLTTSDGLEDFLDPGQVLGAEPFLAPATLLVYGVGRVAGSEGVAGAAGQMLRAQLVSQVLTHSIKFAARRQRPDGTDYAFPSGHASASFAVATVLQHRFGLRAGVPAFAAATYVGASRVTEERHWLSDIVFGAAIGVAAGHAVAVTDHVQVEAVRVLGGVGLGMRWSPGGRSATGSGGR